MGAFWYILLWLMPDDLTCHNDEPWVLKARFKLIIEKQFMIFSNLKLYYKDYSLPPSS